MKKYTHIIWDFNGTLFDDVDAGIASVNKMLSDRGLSTIADKEEYRKIFKFPIIDYYRGLGFDFNSEPYEVLAPVWVELYNMNSKKSKLQDGAVYALELFKEKGIPQLLLSATERNMLKRQTRELGIDEYFDDIYGLDNIHAYSKKELAFKWRRENPDAVPLFIGDTEHDAQVAKAADAECILISCGHQSNETLRKCGCIVCDDLYKLIEFLKNDIVE